MQRGAAAALDHKSFCAATNTVANPIVSEFLVSLKCREYFIFAPQKPF